MAWAMVRTDSGSHSIGTKAPHKKLEPRAMTFTIPLMAFGFLTSVPIKNAILVAQSVNMRAFMI